MEETTEKNETCDIGNLKTRFDKQMENLVRLVDAMHYNGARESAFRDVIHNSLRDSIIQAIKNISTTYIPICLKTPNMKYDIRRDDGEVVLGVTSTPELLKATGSTILREINAYGHIIQEYSSDVFAIKPDCSSEFLDLVADKTSLSDQCVLFATAAKHNTFFDKQRPAFPKPPDDFLKCAAQEPDLEPVREPDSTNVSAETDEPKKISKPKTGRKPKKVQKTKKSKRSSK